MIAEKRLTMLISLLPKRRAFVMPSILISQRFLLFTSALLFTHITFAGFVPFSSRNVINTNSFSRPESIILIDIDRDGDLDGAAAASVEGAIEWWELPGGSNSNWTPHVIDSSFPSANTISSGDVNGDGYVDFIATAGGTTDDVAWWKNVDGTGTNWSKITIDAAFDGARSSSMVDIDGDGRMDVLGAANSAGEIAWWRNVNGPGTNWTKRVIATGFDGANAAASADFNLDGNPDVVGCAGTDNEITWWENVGGAGTNWIAHVIANTFTSAQSIAVIDLDRDGDWDVISAANPSPGGRISWWENLDGTGGTWTSRVITASFNGAYAATPADIDADGDWDILAAAQVADDVTWFENVNGIGTMWTTRTVDGNFDGARSAVAGDIDGDGDLDITAAAFIQNQLAWWINQSIHRSAAYCTDASISTNFQGAQAITTSDIDQDGDADIIGAASIDNRIAWWENADGQGGVWLERLVDTNVPSAWDVDGVDINGDSAPDILGVSRSGNTIAWWKDIGGTGTNWNRTVIDSSFSLAQAAAAADLDRDGDEDVVGASFGSGEIACWKNVGGTGTNWSKHVIANTFTGANGVEIADINGDGKRDVIGSAFTLGAITWWQNVDGSATNWQQHSVDATFSGAMTVTAIDMDRDGDVDVAGASFNLDQITWWENADGTGTNWITHIVDPDVDGANAVLVNDLDADGDLDITGSSSVVNRFAWWENADGSNTNWIRHDLSLDTLDATAVATADFDGDGKIDVAGASGNASAGQDPNILWWKNNGGQFALSGLNTLPAVMMPGSTSTAQVLTFSHRGRAGDADIELTSLSFLFEKTNSVPLNSTDANNLIQNFNLFRDTGSGVYEPGVDTLAAQVSTLSLLGGVQTISFADADPLFQCSAGNSNLYFAVIDITASASGQLFQISLLDDFTTAEDRSLDLALEKECNTGSVVSASSINTVVDLGIGKSGTPDPLIFTSNIVFTITVSNLSSEIAYNVVVTDTLPASVSFNAAGSSPECVATGNVITVALGNVTGTQVRVITVAVSAHGETLGAITNVASVSTTSIDTNPANNSATAIITLPDTDNDAVSDFVDPDDDGDGMPDEWEIQYGFDRTNLVDAAEDGDTDGFSNVQEYIADTIPTNGMSFLAVDNLTGTNPVQVAFDSSTGRVYTLQFVHDLISGSWSNVTGQAGLPGNGSVLILVDSPAVTGRSYRVYVTLP